jgi:hypothetical protein
MPGDTNLSRNNGRNNNYYNHDSRYHLSTNNVPPLHMSSPPIHTGLCYSPLWPTQLMMMMSTNYTDDEVDVPTVPIDSTQLHVTNPSNHLPTCPLESVRWTTATFCYTSQLRGLGVDREGLTTIPTLR